MARMRFNRRSPVINMDGSPERTISRAQGAINMFKKKKKTGSGAELLKRRKYQKRGFNEGIHAAALSHDMKSNFHGAGGWGEVGKTAIRGAAVGGLAGGSIEAMQGGDFWDGAKTGAFMGGTGMAGMKIAKQSTGARKYLGEEGILSNYKGMKEEYGVGVKALMTNQRHVKNATNWVTGNTKKKKKEQG